MNNYNYNDSLSTFHGSLNNIMGTRLDMLITGINEYNSISIWNKIIEELKRINNILNRFNPRSETSIINKIAYSTPIKVSNEMWHILQDCKIYNEITLGLFDITLQDFSKISFLENYISFSEPNLKIDFGGYGKGYALNKIKSILEVNNIDNCFVNFGDSSLLGLGHHPYGNAWKISIENPFNLNHELDCVNLNNQSMSVSGNSPNYYGHIINPISGMPINNKKLIYIITDSPLDAEVFTTAIMAAPHPEKEHLIRKIQEKQNIIISEFKL